MTGSEPAPGNGPLGRTRFVVRALLKKGLNRKSLALTLALGVVLGVLPTIWGSTLLCVLLAALLGLNQVAMQLANYLAYPLQILLFLPFLKLGRQLFGPAAGIGFHELAMGFRHDFRATLTHLGAANLKAVGAWAVLAPLLTGILYLLFLEVLRGMPTSEAQVVKAVDSDGGNSSLGEGSLSFPLRRARTSKPNEMLTDP